MKKCLLFLIILLQYGCHHNWDTVPNWKGFSESERFVAADDINSLSVVGVPVEELNTASVGTKEGIVTLCVEPDVKEELLTPHTVFLDAGLKDIRIYADRVLFRQKSGENIADYFNVVNAYANKYRWPFHKVLALGTARLNVSINEWNRDFIPHVQCRDFWIQFAEQPTEQYDEITFTVAMDILLPDGGERTLTGSVKVVFE